MEIISKICVNSQWVARFLASKESGLCECFGQCKVRVRYKGYIYILTEDEIKKCDDDTSKGKTEL